MIPPPLRTPLIRRDGLLLKPEGAQRTGSVKYRMVWAKVRSAWESGRLAPGMTMVEVTSGSTGAALAEVGRTLGLRVELHAYESADEAKLAGIRAKGATVILHPNHVPMPALLDEVARKVRAGGHWHLGQYDRTSTSAAYEAISDEIVEQIGAAGEARPRRFVCAVGTGGLIQGVGRRLRRALAPLEVIAVEPVAGARIDGMRNTDAAHLGADDPYDRAFPDRRHLVPAPLRKRSVGGYEVGWSATALLDLVDRTDWRDVLVIAAD